MPHNPEPLVLPKSSIVLRLFQRIRDEAHRFAITYHRTLRNRRYESVLEEIPGIGKARRLALGKKFPLLDDLKQATPDEIAETEGISKTIAQNIYDYFHKENK